MKRGRDSNYDGLNIMLIEQVNRKYLKYIIDNIQNFVLDEIVHKHGKKSTLDAQLSSLKSYYNKLDTGGKIKIQYGQKPYVCGRYYAKNIPVSLQNISRKIRHTICKEFYYDIDIKNAHPVLCLDYMHPKTIQILEFPFLSITLIIEKRC